VDVAAAIARCGARALRLYRCAHRRNGGRVARRIAAARVGGRSQGEQCEAAHGEKRRDPSAASRKHIESVHGVPPPLWWIVPCDGSGAVQVVNSPSQTLARPLSQLRRTFTAVIGHGDDVIAGAPHSFACMQRDGRRMNIRGMQRRDFLRIAAAGGAATWWSSALVWPRRVAAAIAAPRPALIRRTGLYGRWVTRFGAPAFLYDPDHETLAARDRSRDARHHAWNSHRRAGCGGVVGGENASAENGAVSSGNAPFRDDPCYPYNPWSATASGAFSSGPPWQLGRRQAKRFRHAG
jgi:hypothetical protein